MRHTETTNAADLRDNMMDYLGRIKYQNICIKVSSQKSDRIIGCLTPFNSEAKIIKSYSAVEFRTKMTEAFDIALEAHYTHLGKAQRDQELRDSNPDISLPNLEEEGFIAITRHRKNVALIKILS